MGNNEILECFELLLDAHRLSLKTIILLEENINNRYNEMKTSCTLHEDAIIDLTIIKDCIVPNQYASLYGIIELQSIRLCKKFDVDKSAKGTGIERMRNLILKSKSKEINSEWSYKHLIEHREIRNCILHANGFISEYTKENEIMRIIKRHDFVSVENDLMLLNVKSLDHLLYCGFSYNQMCVGEMF
jgi:hypothetical protein